MQSEDFVDYIIVHCLALISLIFDRTKLESKVIPMVKENKSILTPVTIDYSHMTVKELRTLLNKKGITGISKFKKSQLLELF